MRRNRGPSAHAPKVPLSTDRAAKGPGPVPYLPECPREAPAPAPMPGCVVAPDLAWVEPA